MNLFGLTGRTALVTGAAQGIGAAVCIALARQGAAVTALDAEPCDDLRDAMNASGTPLRRSDRVDVSDRAQVEASLAGGPSILVHCAAICPWTDWDSDGWDDEAARVFSVNLMGSLNVLRAGLRVMPRGGRVVLISSLAGRNGGLIASPHYVATKGGMNAVVKWAARRAASRAITVNAVAPASIRTRMMDGQTIDTSQIPLGRAGTPEDVAGPVAFLCSDAAGFITGTVLDVNGGVYMAP